MAFLNKLKAVVQAEGIAGIRQAVQKQGTKRFAQDLSANLSLDTLDFCETRRYGLPSHLSAIAVDPVQGLLASGSFKGAIAVSGSSEIACFLELEEAVAVKMMAFQPGSPVLIVIDAKNAITVFDLIKKQRLFVRNARSIVTCMGLLAGSNWLFHGLKDGTIDVFDVYRGQPVPYRIPNILPDGPRHSMVVAIHSHPKDSNQILIAYSTGVVLWNLKLKTVIRTFVFEIPPGAMGGVSAVEGMYGPNESRYPQVTVISWKPDGQGFVSGHDDGCFVFWDIRQERPILARTINEIQVNVPGIKPVFERAVGQFVPIYQLSWCLHENMEDTTLIVAGGSSTANLFGLHLFEYPLKGDYRNPRKRHTLTMDTDILDFVVLPRESPWYNGALDPIAILVLTNRGGIRSFAFDPSHAPNAIPSCLALVEPRVTLAKTYGNLPQEHYLRLVGGIVQYRQLHPTKRLPLHGGHQAPADVARLKRDILVTVHEDASVRFWDGASFTPLPHLTVELRNLFFKNQGHIVAFEYSVVAHVLSVGCSNGNWIYCRLDGHSTVEHHAPEHRISQSYERISHEEAKALPANPQEILPPPQHQENTTVAQESATQPKESTSTPPPPPPAVPDTTGTTTPELSPEPTPSSKELPPVESHLLSPVSTKTDKDLDMLVPVSPVDPVQVKQEFTNLSLSEPPPLPALPPREPSPALPPRPEFVESSLPGSSEFSPAFKSSLHPGRINQIAVSDCGLVAVSDELYSLSITDTRSGRTLHVEDLKVVQLDRVKNTSGQESESSSPAVASLESMQSVGVVLTTLDFVVSTTSDQDKVPSLLLIAGSSNGVFLIFAISAMPPSPNTLRTVRKVECFQTKEKYTSVHNSIISVLSPSDNPTNPTMSASSATSPVLSAGGGAASPMSPPLPPQNPTSGPLPPLPADQDAPAATSSLGHRTSSSESSPGHHHAKSDSVSSSIYSTWKEAQGKVMSKAQQRLNYWVSVSDRGIRLHMNCTSRRINKVDLVDQTKSGPIVAAQVVYHEGACCLLTLTESGKIWLYSVPKLELISIPGTASTGGAIQLPIVLEPERLRQSIIIPDGRLFLPILKYEYRMYSLWGHDRWIQTPQGPKPDKGAGSLRLYDHGIKIPPRPTNTASRGWFGGHSTEDAPSQEDLDELLGGEHYRPENPILKRAGVQGPPGTPVKVQEHTKATTGMAAMMNDTLDALDERGKKLGLLGSKTEEMAESSNDFLKAARELNAKNANKKWWEF